MTITQNTQTATGGGVTFCKRRGWRGLNARPVIVASNNQNVHDWLYRYLEPYGDRGYAFYQADSEREFMTLVQTEKPLLVFIEDCFFCDKAIGKLERIRKQYPKLRLTLFSISGFPVHAAVRYVYWSRGSYLSLRDSDKVIRESLEDIFNKRQAVPPYIRDSVEEYDRLPDKEPYLTQREAEVVRCIADEKTMKKTASCLMVSEKTVTNHLSSVYRKFGTRNRVGVLKLAVSKGILPVDELMTYTVQS
jgi:DNA-binding CsgD family transcriptional regulator